MCGMNIADLRVYDSFRNSGTTQTASIIRNRKTMCAKIEAILVEIAYNR
jgi:DNA modification methylase